MKISIVDVYQHPKKGSISISVDSKLPGTSSLIELVANGKLALTDIREEIICNGVVTANYERLVDEGEGRDVMGFTFSEISVSDYSKLKVHDAHGDLKLIESHCFPESENTGLVKSW
jgi:hypothetical protein